jgi:hypothetical protein
MLGANKRLTKFLAQAKKLRGRKKTGKGDGEKGGAK